MYTDGRWEVNKVAEFDGSEVFAIHNYADNRIRRIANVWIEANAHLIASAPDLYEALRELLADTEKTGYTSVPHIMRAAEALAKAEGKEMTKKYGRDWYKVIGKWRHIVQVCPTNAKTNLYIDGMKATRFYKLKRWLLCRLGIKPFALREK